MAATPILSALPPRGLITELPLIGREEDTKWLLDTPGDRILVAPSGTGKTYLLYWLATQASKGLFIATKDRNELAAAIRDQKPKLLFLDENGFDSAWLESILALRSHNQHFDLVITCWPSHEDRIRSILGPQATVRHLEGLHRRDILEILVDQGIANDKWLVFLADQTGNRPGLAVRLAQSARSGFQGEVLDGRALSRELLLPVELLLGERSLQARQLLSVLALGGAQGVERRLAARCLELPDAEAARLLQEVDGMGFLVETTLDSQPTRLAVEPAMLRVSLVARTFFDGPGKLDFSATAADIPGIEPLETILAAAQSGAPIPRELLFKELESRCPALAPPRDEIESFFSYSNRQAEAWMGLARLGVKESRRILERCPEAQLHEVAPALLEHIPKETIPILLDRASRQPKEASLNLDPIKGWLATPDEAIRVRHILLDVLEQRAPEREFLTTEIEACLAAVSPELSDVGVTTNREAIRMSWGTLLADESWEQLPHLLRRTLDLLLSRLGLFPWKELTSAFNSYRWPRPLTPTTQERGFEIVRYSLGLLRARAQESLAQRFAWIALALDCGVQTDEIFAMRQGYEEELDEAELLFPDFDKLATALPREWLERWATEEPSRVLDRWRRLIPRIQALVPHRYPNLGRISHDLDSKMTQEKIELWIEGLVELEIPEKRIRPFLTRLEEPALSRIMPRLLSSDDYCLAAALEIARRGAPKSLVPKARERLEAASLARPKTHRAADYRTIP